VIKEVEGRALVGFVIEKDGKVGNIEVKHGLNLDISREVERLVGSMPDWHPGYRKGEPVRVQFNLPVTFKLQ
jgi:outer membrane biosynthesis protein TonB